MRIFQLFPTALVRNSIDILHDKARSATEGLREG